MKILCKSNYYRKYLWLIMCSFVLSSSLYAQEDNIDVTGVIVDEQGEPLPGASVFIAGTTTGTISDVNGHFEIVASVGSQLIVSFVGFEKEVIDVTSSMELPIRITLTPSMVTLDEAVVVAVGYGTMRKTDLTGSIASVASEDLKKGVINSTEQVLQGRVAGLAVVQGSGDPASGATLRLRGGTSLTASNNPLIVVDGIPGVDINTVQPSEIKSIDVLKDASATAIYGSRGANGVIIITTNRDETEGVLEYSGYVAIGEVANQLDLLSANQWRQYVRENNIAGAVDYGGDTDWQKELQQTSISQSHAISFSNGTENSGYRASVNYLENEGVIKTTKLERIGASLSGYQYGLDGKLKVEAGLHANRDEWHPLNYMIFERSYNLSPVIPVRDENGEFTNISGTNYENPVEILQNRTADDKRDRLLAYLKAELEILPGLKSITNLSYEYNSHKGNLYIPSYAVITGRTDDGYGQKSLGEYKNQQLETYLNYERVMDIHRFNLLAGYSYLENIYEGFGAERRGFDTDLFLYNNLAAGQDFRAGDVYSYKGSAKLVSFFGRANYTLHGKYMFTGTIRRDGSSRFGENNKWGVFPSGSIAWRLSDESFMDWSEQWLDNLKLRVGYGVTGNQEGIGEYKSLPLLGVGSEMYYDAESEKWKQSYGPIQNANPDLKWESTEQINIGLDFAIKNRIIGSLEVYQKKTSDLLYTYEVPQPPYLVGTMLANVGDLSNKGVELTIDANIMSGKDFNWDTNLTLSSNHQEIDKLSNQAYETDIIYSGSLHSLRGMSNQFSQIIKEGYPVGTFWGYKCSGLDENGAFILGEEKTELGNAQPKLNLGFGMSFTYKKFDASFSTYGMFGQKVLNATAMSMNDPNRLPAQNVPDDFLKSGITSDPTFSDYWIENASFLRLQTATLGYSLPVETLGFSNARIYVTGENLFVITGYSGVDPEVNIGGLESPGIDMFNYYPKPRTISFGVNISF
ncbi:SusC/RagA family TonB-linked outer membrane protein [Anaerophaga thermohalophila]|uniref:SusC/RagA family TonB-linked outer membrane protein n=1 Tax=Anaerophaga thermohalophila TaxID=177400 RepID=UPI000237B8B4|nr:TonB-dependent receptor [Anaerophaga thermohalophila]